MENENNNLNNNQIEQQSEDEDDVLDIPLSQRKVYTAQGDPEIDSLHRKYQNGRLVIQPDFQRHFVWDEKKSSRLIESALMDIPLPVIYLSEEKGGTENVIDGQQRLTAFFTFIDGEYRLSGVNPELQGKAFKDLPEEIQDKIRYYKIRTITFKSESEKDLKFEVFARLNTGAVSLNAQELRNCIYRGPYNELLKELSIDSDYKYLMGFKEPDKRMKDVEYVLRFASFYHCNYMDYRPTIKSFLNKDMEEHRNISETKANELKHAFKNTVSIIRSLLDKHAFKRFNRGNEKNPNGYWSTAGKRGGVNSALYDILMWSFAKTEKNKVFQNMDSIREAFIDLMSNDPEFIDSIELSTSGAKQVQKRFDKWRLTLWEILDIIHKEPRCFSRKLKEELYNHDPTCTICGQRIENIDDGAIDHIKQYWTGGRTIPENARLTHRYCNWARPRKEAGIREEQSKYILKKNKDIGQIAIKKHQNMDIMNTLDEKITMLTQEVDKNIRRELQQHLETIRGPGNPIGILTSMSRLCMKLLDNLFEQVGEKRPSDNLFHCICRAGTGNRDNPKIEGLHILPDEKATYFQSVRTLSNKADHASESSILTRGDAENALNNFIRVLEWFYCEFEKGPCLATIYESTSNELS